MSDINTVHLTGFIKNIQDRQTGKGGLFSTFTLVNRPDGPEGIAIEIPLATFGNKGGLLFKKIANEGCEVDITARVTMRSYRNEATGKVSFFMQLTVGNFNIVRLGADPVPAPVPESAFDHSKEDDIMSSLPF